MQSCPTCGAPNPASSKFCADCGARLGAPVVEQEQRKTVTVLFSDVTGSTDLGERLEPESLRRMLAQFFEAARRVIESHGGAVEKFIGDAVMSVFGVPTVHEDDALRALRAALDLMAAVGDLNIGLQRDFGATLQIRVGVNTGDVVTGTAERLATGDAVNVAARLEQLAPPGQIYVGETTAELAGAAATLEELDPAMLKGKSAPVRVFRLLGATTAERPVRDTPMIGRKRQLEMLRGAFDQAVADKACVLVTVLGAAGVGKSRLAAEFLGDLDATVVRSRCLSYGTGIGLWPAVDVVHQLQAGPVAPRVAELLDDDEAVADALRALVDGDVALTSSTDLSWAFRRVLEQAASERPLVVVLDDLHWAEQPLFELVEHLITLSRDAPILVLAMARPELLERRQGWGSGALNASTALLEPLGEEETGALVDLLSSSLDATAREKVREAAAGNPLFAEEMVALVEASGGGEVRVPPTIQALLAARLDQLEPAELRALERGSIEGQSFHRRGLAALDPDEPDLPQRLLGLVRKDLLRPDRPTLDRDEAFRFRHLLFRDAAYDRLPKSARAELHERFARWLEEQTTDVAEREHLVGYHLEQAYRYRVGLGPVDDGVRRLAAEAAQSLRTAGRRQLMRFDLAGAIDLLDRASDLAPPEKPDVSLELGVASAVLMCGRPAEAVERAAAAEQAALKAGDRVGALQAELGRLCLQLQISTGNVVRQLKSRVEAVLPEIAAAGEDGALAWTYWSALHVAHNACRFGDGLEAALKCREHAARSADPFLMTHIALMSAHIAYGPTPIPRALEMLEDVRQDAAGYNPWVDEMRSTLLGYSGRFDEAREVEAAAFAAFRERGMTLAVEISGQGTWQIEMAAGNVEAAAAAARTSCDRLEHMGERGFMSTNAAQLAEALFELGKDAEAEHWVARSLELGDADDAVTQAQARSVRGLLRARRGEFDAARSDVNDALAITAEMQSPQTQGEVALHAATVFSAAGDRAAAEEQARRAVALFTEKDSMIYAARAAAALDAITGG